MADNVGSQIAVAKPASHVKNDFEEDNYILRQFVTKILRASTVAVFWALRGRRSILYSVIVMSIVFSTIFG